MLQMENARLIVLSENVTRYQKNIFTHDYPTTKGDRSRSKRWKK